MSAIDLDMLAVDLADMLSKHGYDLDAAASDIRPHLDAFVANIQQAAELNTAAALTGSDAATWTAGQDVEEPRPRASRRPRMTYLPWRRSQLVNIGATATDEHYWQCPHTGCKTWAGPYSNPHVAKQAGFEHIYTAHADWYYRRGR